MNVVISSDSGYPSKYTAGNVKSDFIIRGLKEAGADVLFIDTLWGTEGVKKMTTGISPTGVPYISFPRKHGIMSIFYNFHLYCKVIKQRKEVGGPNVFIDAPLISFINIICFLITKFYGYKIALLSHEFYQSINQKSKLSRFNVWANDCVVPRFVDCIHPISHFLLEYNKRFRKPMTIIPILADYSNVDVSDMVHVNEPYFAFCGSALYFLRNTVLVESFKLLHSKYPSIKFKIVLGQLGNQRGQIDALINEYNLSDNIMLFSGLPQDDLYNIYKNAVGLLIPLNPNSLQDIARFSQKIAEYVACGRPIITSPIGEIPYYFQNKVNAMVVDYTPNAYAEAMFELLLDRSLADELGRKGFATGVKEFDYMKIGGQLFNFYTSLQKSNSN